MELFEGIKNTARITVYSLVGASLVSCAIAAPSQRSMANYHFNCVESPTMFKYYSGLAVTMMMASLERKGGFEPADVYFISRGGNNLGPVISTRDNQRDIEPELHYTFTKSNGRSDYQLVAENSASGEVMTITTTLNRATKMAVVTCDVVQN